MTKQQLKAALKAKEGIAHNGLLVKVLEFSQHMSIVRIKYMGDRRIILVKIKDLQYAKEN